MPKVLSGPNFDVYVYDERGQPHNGRHCDVRWSDGLTTKVALPTLLVYVGRKLTPTALKLLSSNVERLSAEWERLNPRKDQEV